ncbi:U-box domain-containing protein 4-like [Phoenix dactylifera]|uniref:U-box domain-containing protein 4-like n=1 Tax=Phoenix dactylifera TaxID=42345 RepID=A0A8B9AJC9_PHODC|nr:U-box domain-containing protein 4-like [Phoenix dactylifera]
MGRSFSDGVDPSGAFSECNSDRSGELIPAANSVAAHHRLLISCDVEYSDDVVHGLISDLESPSVPIESQRHAAMVLRLLAKHKSENRLKMARAGAIRPLVALLSHHDPQLQEHGVTAILNLSLCDENKDPIAAAGAIRPLILALKTGTPAARENAACALIRLSKVEEHKIAIGRAGAIPHLVDLLETGGLRGKKDASTALFLLCSARENKLRAVKEGIVRPLLELMADPGSGMVDKAAYVLNSVVEVAEGRAAAVEEAAIPVLVEMVELGSRRQKEKATSTLLQICEESVTYRTMVSREGAIPPLVALSQSGTTQPEQVEALIEMLRRPRAAEGGEGRQWRG